MRMKRSTVAVEILASLTLMFIAACLPVVRAQNSDELMPVEGAVKAKGVLEQAIAALGGPAYLNIRT